MNGLFLFTSPYTFGGIQTYLPTLVYYVCWDRESRAGAQQSRGVQLRASFRIELGLEVDDGAAAHQETVLRQESRLANLLGVLLENK